MKNNQFWRQTQIPSGFYGRQWPVDAVKKSSKKLFKLVKNTTGCVKVSCRPQAEGRAAITNDVNGQRIKYNCALF
jgi:hypothetical protein